MFKLNSEAWTCFSDVYDSFSSREREGEDFCVIRNTYCIITLGLHPKQHKGLTIYRD